jgi:hypothetical protein
MAYNIMGVHGRSRLAIRRPRGREYAAVAEDDADLLKDECGVGIRLGVLGGWVVGRGECGGIEGASGISCPWWWRTSSFSLKNTSSGQRCGYCACGAWYAGVLDVDGRALEDGAGVLREGCPSLAGDDEELLAALLLLLLVLLLGLPRVASAVSIGCQSYGYVCCRIL